MTEWIRAGHIASYLCSTELILARVHCPGTSNTHSCAVPVLGRGQGTFGPGQMPSLSINNPVQTTKAHPMPLRTQLILGCTVI